METAFKINKKNKKVRNDTSVQGTNDSSILSKISICQCGYFDDKFLSLFGAKIVRRSPLINRGYFIRAKIVDYVLKCFISTYGTIKNQIVNLGCGFDSTFYRLKYNGLLENTLFIEVDFPDVVNRKFNMINAHKELLDLCPDLTKKTSVNDNVVYFSESSNYLLIGADLRNTVLVETILKSIPGFDENHPTLLLSEVVLTYMAVNSCNSVLKWISQTFKNCLVAAYEQVHPHDSFGQVMCAHFNKLGSPLKCILKYPTKEDQILRYSSFGYNSGAVRMIDFYMKIISQEERERVRKLELFDEYEQWHLKCTHYVMILGSTGSLLIPQIEALRQLNLLETRVCDTTSIGLSEFPVTFGIRYSHSLCYSSLDKRLFVFGGFGESLKELGKHKRQRSIEIIDLNTNNIEIIDYLDDQIGDRYFSTTHVLNNSTILLLFGRAGPNKPSKSAIFTLNETKFNIKEFDLTLSEYKPLNRWRHASCKISNDQIFVYGGMTYDERTSDFIILNDAFVINPQTEQVNEIKFNFNEFVPRHSHSMCLWNEFIVITGGLDSDENPLDDIIMVDSKDFSFKRLQFKKNQIQPRYSHSSVVIDDTLILVGGVNFSSKPVGICIIDLKREFAVEFDLPVQSIDSSPLMIVNHQIHLIDKDNLLLVGGGGNCFSFGTHINKKPLIFNISNLWKLLNEFESN